jgi:3-deoxy-D-manno-octulosonic-acid transferase
VWLAASTHPGEELMIAKVHASLSAAFPNLLTIIVPRHPARGATIAADMPKLVRCALRSQHKTIPPNTHIYIADTLGELGLFYRLCEVVFMGGSLVAHGGQNPLEPGRLSCAILTGPHTHNFNDIYAEMEKAGCCLRVATPEALAQQVGTLLAQSASRQKQQAAVKQWMEGKGGTADRLMQELAPVFDPRPPEPPAAVSIEQLVDQEPPKEGA